MTTNKQPKITKYRQPVRMSISKIMPVFLDQKITTLPAITQQNPKSHPS
ncbi:MAG: hypothetical protein OXC40_01250 [Proteobacteria bacterium]|nr:hypothetical protein [Pseudomonadota bacterium]